MEWIEVDYSKAARNKTELIMLQYAEKLTKRPDSILQEDINLLKATGFDDRAIHDICTITAYYNFINRIASGLGVELEERFDK
jgi:uncharacterized peroxidase-related enzyme